MRSPILLDSASTITGRVWVEAFQRLDQPRLEHLLTGLGLVRQGPEQRPAMASEGFQINGLQPQIAQAAEDFGLARPGVAVEQDHPWSGLGVVERGGDPPPPVCDSRLAPRRRASRPGRTPWPWRWNAGRRASSRSAAHSRRPCRPAGLPDVRRCSAPHARRRSAGPESAIAAHRWSPPRRAAASVSTGRLMAPGIWSKANSPGLRTSMISAEPGPVVSV